ncbi:MAG TPA: 50S ribosomal protein L6 [Nitrospiria bacterium]|nr:50S ribosomal protein L6 [Nitrospiria bacterium]
MSRIGRKELEVPKGVDVKVVPGVVRVKGPKGELSKSIHPNVSVLVENGRVRVSRASEDKADKALHGMVRNEIKNMVEGVSQGYERVLEITGVGFRAQVQGKKLLMSLGYTHQIEFPLPAGVDAAVDKQTVVTLRGADKQLVGQTAAKIRSMREPEPYKGKGVKYAGERIIRKEGKTGK